ATSFALIKELAGVSWHLLGRLVPAFWTGNRRSFNQSAARLRCLAVIGKHQKPRLYAASCPRWVISGHVQRKTSCPLYPRKRHQMRHNRMSAKGQKRTLLVNTRNSREQK